MKPGFAFVAALSVAVAAGTGQAQEPGSFFGEGCVLDTEAAPCDDCISFEHITTLGSDQLGPGFLVDTGAMDVVRDSLGNYWVGQEERIKVFAAPASLRGQPAAHRGPPDTDRRQRPPLVVVHNSAARLAGLPRSLG